MGWTVPHIFQHLQLWSINIWQRLADHLPCVATYMLTCVSEIPITLYWIIKRLLRLCFLQMLHARWISLDSRGKWPRIAMVIYESVEAGSSSCYWNRQQFHIGTKQQAGEVCACSRQTPSAPKCTLKSFFMWTEKLKMDKFICCLFSWVSYPESAFKWIHDHNQNFSSPNWGLSREHNFARNLYLMVILRAICPQLVTITSCCVLTLLTGVVNNGGYLSGIWYYQ